MYNNENCLLEKFLHLKNGPKIFLKSHGWRIAALFWAHNVIFFDSRRKRRSCSTT